MRLYGVHRIEILQREIEKQHIGKYQLVSQLAQGGMGRVFLAQHPLLRRPCAIKLIRPDCARDPRLLARFEREVQVLAELSHPNAVQIFDYGHTDNGTFYYVMEYLEGVGVDQLVNREGSLRCERVVAILLQVCSALRRLHNGGLIHRDLTPSNIFVCQPGGSEETVKLLDFGLVKISEDSSRAELTQYGEIIGTPAFMSPEQASGKVTDVRTDIYSLGAVAYFMLCGVPPLLRQSVVETLHAHIHQPYVPLDQLQDGIDSRLADVVHRCLAKDPAKRFASVAELTQALASTISPVIA